VSAHAHKNWGTDYESNAIFVRSVSLVLMVLSIFMAIYAAYNFYYRGEMLQCVLLYQYPLLPSTLGHDMLPTGNIDASRSINITYTYYLFVRLML
jgi:hypothetical protein